MNKIKILRKLIVLSLIILITSCAAKTPTVTIEDSQTEAILERISRSESAIRSIKGLAKVKIKTRDDKISYTQVTIAKRPDLLRLEALNPFGKTVGFISSDGDNIYIISPSERAVYDANTEFDLASLYPGLNLKITSENLVNLILGRLPESVFDLSSSPELSADGNLIKLTFHSQTTELADYLWVNKDNFRVERAEFYLHESQKATINYEYFADLKDGLYFPKTIDFKSKGLSITIVYEQDIELNKEVNKSLFRPQS
ncbi:MAG: DUF4292 domain-containing protein [Thermodesulfobacteriota bacterium]